MTKPDFLKNSMIIAAHPDDELLWFASVIDKVDQVVLIFEDFWPDPKIGPARAEALANYPRAGVTSLRLSEAATYGCANWEKPVLTEYGLKLCRNCELRNVKQLAKRLIGKSSAPLAGIREHYKANFQDIVDRLRPMLKPDMNIITHNPWGEYGHEDHVLVFRAISKLREEIGFTLWMSNYCTERSLPLAKTYFDVHDPEFIEMPVDREFAETLADVYREAGCWTWNDEWHWFKTENFMRAPRNQKNIETQGHLFPFNFFNIEAN